MKIENYITYEDLLQTIKENGINCDLAKLDLAFKLCKEYHKNQFRKTGHPYYVHPLAVANIVALIKLDETSIIAALLHDVIEDTSATIEEISSYFGEKVAEIVNGVTKLKSIKYKSDELQQAENLRKLFLALSKDIRVLVIKICDRLHNMLTMDGIKNRKKKRAKAIETLDIYAPLAHRVGLYHIKDLLENLSFDIINPRASKLVERKIQKIIDKMPENYLQNEISELQMAANEQNIKYEIQYRQKSNYSIWKKMENKNRVFENIFDIFGYRIITENVDECYKMLHLIHKTYLFTPNSFMDYISNPKPNQYKSIHTSVIDKNGVYIEFQIRTKQMHMEAEFGLAAHWNYKVDNTANLTKEFQIRWVDQILDILNSKSPLEEILEYTKLEVNNDKILVFTKDGNVVYLPQNSKILDFAFYILPKKGCFFKKATINNLEITDIDHILQNGDKITLFFGEQNMANAKWLNYVQTGKAKIAIKKAIAAETKAQTANKGFAILKQACFTRGILCNQTTINLVKENLEENDENEMYIKFFHGIINPIAVLDKIFNFQKAQNHERSAIYSPKKDFHRVFLKNIKNLRCFISECCNDIEFPASIKLIIEKNGAFIHKPSCRHISHIAPDNKNVFFVPDANIQHNENLHHFLITIDINLENKMLDHIKQYKISFLKKDIIYDKNEPSTVTFKLECETYNEMQKILQDKFVHEKNIQIKLLNT